MSDWKRMLQAEYRDDPAAHAELARQLAREGRVQVPGFARYEIRGTSGLVMGDFYTAMNLTLREEAEISALLSADACAFRVLVPIGESRGPVLFLAFEVMYRFYDEYPLADLSWELLVKLDAELGRLGVSVAVGEGPWSSYQRHLRHPDPGVAMLRSEEQRWETATVARRAVEIDDEVQRYRLHVHNALARVRERSQ